MLMWWFKKQYSDEKNNHKTLCPWFFLPVSSKTSDNPTGVRELRTHFSMDLDVFQCYYANCVPPPDIEEVPPPDTRPDDAVFWSQAEAWSFSEEGYGSYYGPGEYGPPPDDTDVKIMSGKFFLTIEAETK